MTETPIYHQHPDWSCFLGLYVLAGTGFLLAVQFSVGFAFFVLAVSAGLAAYGRYRRTYLITSQRVLMRIGLLARNTNEMEIRHVRGINVRQGLLDRLLGIGSVEIISAADGGAEVVFVGVRDPFGVRDMVRSLREAL